MKEVFDMKKIYIVTGANGHLGNTLIRLLRKQEADIRGLILAGEEIEDDGRVRYIKGDVRDIESLRPLFEDLEGKEAYVFHTAGIVAISEKVSPLLYEVNVNGTKNVIALCREYSVRRLVYVSSVHAIPDTDSMSVLKEIKEFSPEKVVGGYARTKAEATQAVLAAVQGGLDAVIVQPSGIIGPYDHSGNHLVQLVTDYLGGRIPVCVKGGYDLVDVRDVAYGCLMAAEKGKSGECYILSNRHYEIQEVLKMVRRIAGGRRIPVIPSWMAHLAAPLMQWYARRRKERPLYTGYSLYALKSNDKFSHEKAVRDLGYQPRDLYETLKDTVRWQKKNGD